MKSVDTIIKSQSIEILRNSIIIPPTTLTLPPRLNNLWNPYVYTDKRGNQQVGFKLSAEGREYASHITPFINAATRGSRGLIEELRKDTRRKLYIISRSYLNANRTDVDSYAKCLQDSLEKILGINDNRVIKHDLEKYVDKQYLPRIVVEVLEARYI